MNIRTRIVTLLGASLLGLTGAVAGPALVDATVAKVAPASVAAAFDAEPQAAAATFTAVPDVATFCLLGNSTRSVTLDTQLGGRIITYTTSGRDWCSPIRVGNVRSATVERGVCLYTDNNRLTVRGPGTESYPVYGLYTYRSARNCPTLTPLSTGAV